MTETRLVSIADLQPHPRNYNGHGGVQLERLQESLRRFGQVRSIVVWRNFILAGHGVTEAARTLGLDTLRADVLPDDYPETLALAYVVADNELARLSDPDDAALLAILNDVKESGDVLLEALGFSTEGIDRYLGELAAAEAKTLADLPPRAPHGYVPDAIWPTDNEWGVPVLDLNMQAFAVDAPVNAWGASGRKAKMGGTFHFYTDDYRFEGLWRDPASIVHSGCLSVVEPNYSTNIQMPHAVVLWHTYRKRWLARFWQAQGLRIFVDLDVCPSLQPINLMGVPVGWKSFACYMRQSDHEDEELDVFLGAAKARRGSDDVLLLVVGGNENVQAMCKERPQCVWVPSFDQMFYQKKLYRNVVG